MERCLFKSTLRAESSEPFKFHWLSNRVFPLGLIFLSGIGDPGVPELLHHCGALIVSIA